MLSDKSYNKCMSVTLSSDGRADGSCPDLLAVITAAPAAPSTTAPSSSPSLRLKLAAPELHAVVCMALLDE